ncbi:MAG: CoA pyrophosphatase [Candidatus Lokiarchaeota archaeon]|nr:CoA pyrophosphatase [Candidatus Lokiarchaeota archaeon]
MPQSDLIYDEIQIKSKLYPFNSPLRTKLKNKNFINSAVLFLIIPYDKRPYEIIIIQRSDKGLTHPGEMAFPGGKFNPYKDKDLIDTAIRETEEEIGISKNNIKILGCLNDIPTISKYIITPFIAKIIGNIKLIPEEREVVDIIKVPIIFFFNRTRFKEKFYQIKDSQFPVFYYDYYDIKKQKNYLIWGATAKMITKFINKVYGYNISNLDNQDFDLKKFHLLKEFEIKEKKDF